MDSPVNNSGSNVFVQGFCKGMKRSLKIFAAAIMIALGSGFVSLSIAEDVSTAKIDCQKAGMRWTKASKCIPPAWARRTLSTPVRIIGLFGILCAVLGLIALYRSRLE
jgi:hypothetical protein